MLRQHGTHSLGVSVTHEDDGAVLREVLELPYVNIEPRKDVEVSNTDTK